MAFDLDAFVASQGNGPFTFTFGGQEWTWPPLPDIRALAALAKDPPDAITALGFMFHPDDWSRFIDETGGGLTPTVIAKLFDQHAQHCGSSLGEPSASSGSSRSTAGRSKRTSKSTTRRTSSGSSRKAAGGASAS